MRQRRSVKLVFQNGELRSLSSRALFTALGWIGLPVFLEVCGSTNPQCVLCNTRLPSSSSATMGAVPLGKIAVSGCALPNWSFSARTLNSCRMRVGANVLA